MGLEALARYERRCKNLLFGAGDQPPRVTVMIIASDSHATQCASAGGGEYAEAFLNLSGTKKKKGKKETTLTKSPLLCWTFKGPILCFLTKMSLADQ